MYLDTNRFNQAWRAASLLAKADIVPAQYRGKPENCFVALQMATRMEIDPFMFMQNTYIVQGKPGMEAKLAIALMNKRGPFRGPVQWFFNGTRLKDDWTCTAWAVHKETGEKCSASVSWGMAVAEGWTTKSGSKWKTMPEMMFQYRSAMFLARLYCPEVLMGMPSADELEDTGDKPAYVVVDAQMVNRDESRTSNLLERIQQQAAPAPATSVKEVVGKLKAKGKAEAPPVEFCSQCGGELAPGEATVPCQRCGQEGCTSCMAKRGEASFCQPCLAELDEK
jgi:hypothetical protein